MQSGRADGVSNVFDGWGYMLKIVGKNAEAMYERIKVL